MKNLLLNNIRIRYKLILLNLMVTLPIICISGFFLIQSSRLSYENTRNLSYVSSQQLASNLTDELTEMYDISDRLLSESTLRTYVSTSYDTSYESYYAFITTLKPVLDVTTIVNDALHVQIYSDNPMLRFSPSTNRTLENLKASKWYDEDAESGSDPVWITEEADKYGAFENRVGFYKLMHLPAEKLSMPGYTMALCITMEETSLYSLISEEAMAGRIVFLYQDNGSIVTTTERDAVFTNLAMQGLRRFVSSSNMYEEQRIIWHDTEYLAIRQPIRNKDIGITGWNLLYLVPTEQASIRASSLVQSSLLICSLCLVISLLVTYLFANNILSRIGKLSSTIRSAWNEKFNVRTEVTGNDEIGTLEINFNAMIQKIDLLRDEVFQTSLKYHAAELQRNQVLLEKREAEISALCAQIHPHYLFNTLEAIKMNLLVKRNIEETGDILTIFAENFRFFIDTSTDIVSLQDELYFLRNYTAIQKYSYGNAIRYSFSISEEVLSARLPKLLLQPLVENALYHGVLPRGSGTIKISVQPGEDGGLNICVSDDGVGMDTESLERITTALAQQKPLNKDTGKQIALSNISRRLNFMYGSNASMHIESAPNAGTTITIFIPRNIEKRSHVHA